MLAAIGRPLRAFAAGAGHRRVRSRCAGGGCGGGSVRAMAPGTMELLRGETALAAVRPLLAAAAVPAVAVDPGARTGGALQLVAIATHAGAAVVDASATPGLGAVLAAATRLGGYDAKALQRALLRAYGAGAPRWACVRLSEQLLAGGRDTPLDLDAVAARYGLVPPELGAGLASFAAHARALAALIAAQIPLLRQDGLAWPSRIEAAAVAPIAAMEHHGMPFDAARWRALGRQTAIERERMKGELGALFRAAGQTSLLGEVAFDLDNDHELKRALAALGQPVPDARRATLASLPPPLGPLLARYRELAKLVTAYGEGFLDRVADDGRLHATFEQIGASTGRLSCREPNLQAVVKDAPHRECFRAGAGRLLVIADYATCELRILAEMSGDPVFADAFARGEDLHARVASRVFGKPVSKTENPELRERAKAVSFGLVYGMGAQGLARAVGTDLRQAEALLDRYFETFPRIGAFLGRAAREALERGYACTMTGRRLYLDPGGDRHTRAAAERLAKNMPIQGTSADITKIALARLHGALAAVPGALIVNTVHDEILVECDAARAPEVAALVSREMGAAAGEVLKTIPAAVDVAVGEFWRK